MAKSKAHSQCKKVFDCESGCGPDPAGYSTVAASVSAAAAVDSAHEARAIHGGAGVPNSLRRGALYASESGRNGAGGREVSRVGFGVERGSGILLSFLCVDHLATADCVANL